MFTSTTPRLLLSTILTSTAVFSTAVGAAGPGDDPGSGSGGNGGGQPGNDPSSPLHELTYYEVSISGEARLDWDLYAPGSPESIGDSFSFSQDSLLFDGLPQGAVQVVGALEYGEDHDAGFARTSADAWASPLESGMQLAV